MCKRLKKGCLLIFIIVMGTMLGCENSVASKQMQIRFDTKEVSLVVGQKKQIKVKNVSRFRKIKWSSSKKKIANVNSKGKITAKRAGKTTITAKIGKKSYKLNVIVRNLIKVKKNGAGDYKSINEAISNANENDIIKVYPGTYNEVVIIPDMNISLVGTDKEKCIIKNTTGLYKNAPVFAYGNFLLENLTVQMTTEDVGKWQPSYVGSNAANTFPGYAIHIDHSNSKDDGTIHKSLVKNCKFYSEAFPAAGVGINANQIISFINCEFVRNCQELNYRNDNCQGAFVGHSANYDVKNQTLVLENCKFISNYGNAANFLMTLAGEKNAKIKAINNQFWSEELKSSNCVEYKKGKSMLDKRSRRNTANCLNYK